MNFIGGYMRGILLDLWFKPIICILWCVLYDALGWVFRRVLRHEEKNVSSDKEGSYRKCFQRGNTAIGVRATDCGFISGEPKKRWTGINLSFKLRSIPTSADAPRIPRDGAHHSHMLCTKSTNMQVGDPIVIIMRTPWVLLWSYLIFVWCDKKSQTLW